jgi:hypothetical protein
LAPQRRACDRGISYRFDVGAVARFDAYFAQIGACLRDKRKREAFAMRAFGILREGERESAEPIAAHACVDVGEMQHMHDKLLHFLSRASWDAASPDRRQLLLPVSDNYFCRSQPLPSAYPTAPVCTTALG